MNALYELEHKLQAIKKTFEDISWAVVALGDPDGESTQERCILERGCKECEEFKDRLETIEYDSGYGVQYLYGVVVFNDGTWLERGEYDGAEWWQYKKTPSYEMWMSEEGIEVILGR